MMSSNPVRPDGAESPAGPAASIPDDLSLEERYTKLLHDYGERVKEQRLYYGTTVLLQDNSRSPEQILGEVVMLIPPGWQYPEICAARIAAGDITVATPNYRSVPWVQQADLRLKDGSRGTLEVIYLEEKPPEAEGPFLVEERNLINSLAELVTMYLNRKIQEHELEEKLREVESVRRRSEMIIQQNPIPMLTIDTAMNVVGTNAAFVDLSGYGREQIVGLSARSFDVRDLQGEGLAVARKQKRRAFGEMTVQLPSGLFTLQQWAIPLQSETGEVQQILAVFVDVTGQREKERQVQALMEEAQVKADVLDRSVRELAAGLAAVAKGDLTSVVSIGEADPLAQVKADFNSAMGAIAAAVTEINQAIVQVEGGAAETSKGSEEIARAAEQVAHTSQRCADLSRRVLEQMENIDRQIADLSASNEEIASTSQDVLERAQNAARQGKQAQDLGDEANTKMKIVEGIARQSVEEIEGLNAQMREINNIVKLITDIANQVNLLALNAAIEAARAGEHGRGFAVVAGEVRNLAGEAKSATGHIEKVIDGIRTSSEKTAAAITSAHTEIGAGVSSVTKTIEALHTIISEADVVAHGLGEIARATEDQADSTNRVVQGMAEGTRLTKETQNQMDDLAALAEEASASTEEIGSAVYELGGMAGRLKKDMQRFRV